MSYRIPVVALVLSVCAWSLPVHAAQRTYVSLLGSDANTASSCSAGAPCRTFSAALTVTDADGEVIAKDSAPYGPVTITKSVSIIAPAGVHAGISVFSGQGVEISTPGVNVVLRGLSINGMGGTRGVRLVAGASLTVDRCTISNFGGEGLWVGAAATVAIIDSLFTRNSAGIFMLDSGATVTVSRTRILGSESFGLWAIQSVPGTTTVSVSQSEASGGKGSGFSASANGGGTARLDIRDSVVSGNAAAGIYATASGGTARMSVSTSLISGNSSGFYAVGTGATITAGGNTVTHNKTGFYQDSSAIIESTGDNIVRGNTTDTNGKFVTVTAVTKM